MISAVEGKGRTLHATCPSQTNKRIDFIISKRQNMYTRGNSLFFYSIGTPKLIMSSI